MKSKLFLHRKFRWAPEFKVWGFPVGLFGLALAVRIPWLWEIPEYIDELREVNLGYQIYLGNVFPLHNAAKEIGALHNYILAGIFSLFGSNTGWPRLYVAITSALTVVLVYYLGKKLYNSTAGAIAAGLLLTNGMHILVTHMAWSNCTTPFFFVLAVLGTILAEEKKSGKWLIAAGFLWALALQTHSSVIVSLMVAISYVLTPGFRKKAGFRTTDYLKAAIAFVLGYGNMIFYNLTSGFESVRWLSAKQYTLETHPGIVSFGNNAFKMLVELIRSVSSIYGTHENGGEYFTHPGFILGLLLLGGSILWAVKAAGKPGKPGHGLKLLVGFIIGGFLVIPWMNHRYEFFVVTRYIMPVIICAIVLIGAFLANLLEKLHSKGGFSRKVRAGVGVALVIIMAAQLGPFYQYCRRLNGTDLSNHVNLEVLRQVKEVSGRGKTMVLIDRNLAVKDLPVLLRMSKIKYINLPKGNPSEGSSALQILVKKNHLTSEAKMVAILSTPLYQRLKDRIPVPKVKHFSQQLLPNTNSKISKREVIHIMEIDNPHILYSTNFK